LVDKYLLAGQLQMASQNKNFISFVALGGPNPQILNIDFLRNNKILEFDQEPFASLSVQEKLVKKFLSVPGFANLVLENIEFIVDEGRFQISEKDLSEWTDTRIIEIAKKYFDVLPYTPLKLVGVNLNSTITFESGEEASKFQELFLPKDGRLAQIISMDNITASTVLRYRYPDEMGRVMLTVDQPNKENKKRTVNFNYEFDFTDWANFRSELDKLPQIAYYADSIVDQLLKGI